MTEEKPAPRRRGHRRVTSPATSGQPEEQEAQPVDPLHQTGEPKPDDEQDERAEWLKEERPPHW